MSVSSTRSRRQLAFWRRLGAVALSILPMDAVWAADACTVASRPQADFDAICTSDSLICELESLANTGIVEWAWDFGDESAPYFASTGSSFFREFPAAGLYLVTLTVTDGNGQLGTTTRSVAVRMEAGDVPDLAQPDQLTATSGQDLLIAYQQLLDNDAVGVAFDHFDAPSSGILQPSTFPATLKYTPPTLTVPAATDAFYYTVKDGSGHYGSALVTIAVSRPDPIANPDHLVSVGVNRALTFRLPDMLRNDVPPDAFFHGFRTSSNCIVEELAPDTSGRLFRFTPAYNFIGFASFEYEISWDGTGPTAVGLVTVEVRDAGPWADFSYQCVNRTCTFNPAVWDDVGLVEFRWDFGNGETLFRPNWFNFNYTFPRPGRFTVDFTVKDTAGNTSNKKLAVYPNSDEERDDLPFYPPGSDQYRLLNAKDVLANTAPVAVDDVAGTERDIAVTIPVLANDSDADDDPFYDSDHDGNPNDHDEDPLLVHSVTLTHPGASFQVVPYNGTWAIRFTPPDSYVGMIGGTYVVSDSWGGTDTGAFTVDVTAPTVAIAFAILIIILLFRPAGLLGRATVEKV